MTFDQDTASFSQWLTLHRVELSSKVLIADLRALYQGRGVVALEDIAEDEVVFSIPRSAILNVETSALSSLNGNRDVLAGLGQWEALILVLLYEQSLGAASNWASYFGVLPTEFSSLMYWSDAELALLEPSLVGNRIGKDSSVEMYERLFPAVVEALGVAAQIGSTTIEDFHKIGSLIMAYSFDCQKPDFGEDEDDEDDEDEYLKCMVPLADTLNADTTLANVNLMSTPEELVMKSVKAISKGEQIYNTYGDHPNAEILRRYGYVEWSGSKFDFAEIPLNSIKQVFVDEGALTEKFWETMLHTIADTELEEIDEEVVLEAYDCYNDGTVLPELFLLLQVATLANQIASSDKSILEQKSKDTRAYVNRILKKCCQLVESGKLTQSVEAVWAKLLTTRLANYPQVLVQAPAFVTPEDVTSKQAISQCIHRSEINSLNACGAPFSDFKFIEDEKMIKAITAKREIESKETRKSKKQRR
ncbi:hypothetical protein BABINDRAFT_163687 [Babjeviella inositovora NRRL Y-12698]|uniref:Ribosomal lysine N-methyltransferase 4 n=1 Tax=Babjeviella inositovora NRRL Y-12698 TaxID=984486 RepID=A0A1E3QHK1_9ASCO|nr:uncharacterized protein BABINDRAFT_163687 [Babjeviella inositovora NRRL Y-12698]ODQ77175.1 hypothetical protein BABINDRAFT_163687 [Babjeviella inositovora NRRL Y-12698]